MQVSEWNKAIWNCTKGCMAGPCRISFSGFVYNNYQPGLVLHS